MYRIAGNFRGQADLHAIFSNKNVAYRNACNEIKRNFYLMKLPAIRYIVWTYY